MNFKDFKKQQQEFTESVKKLIQPAKNNYKDDRFWKFTKDAAGNANAIIRFLPQKDLSKSPVQLIYKHGSQIKGRWLIDECPVTIGKKCPICEYAGEIWDSNEDLARKLYRSKRYVANILVIDDPSEPENNGKIFLFSFGKKIYDKILEIIAPEDEDEESFNIFDFDEGVNFKLKITQVGGHNNYDKSKFLLTKKSIGDDKKQEEVFNSLYDLDKFLDPELFKTYETLQQKLNSILNNTNVTTKNIQEEIKKETKLEPVEEVSEENVEEVDEEDIDFDALLADD